MLIGGFMEYALSVFVNPALYMTIQIVLLELILQQRIISYHTLKSIILLLCSVMQTRLISVWMRIIGFWSNFAFIEMDANLIIITFDYNSYVKPWQSKVHDCISCQLKDQFNFVMLYALIFCVTSDKYLISVVKVPTHRTTAIYKHETQECIG